MLILLSFLTKTSVSSSRGSPTEDDLLLMTEILWNEVEGVTIRVGDIAGVDDSNLDLADADECSAPDKMLISSIREDLLLDN